MAVREGAGINHVLHGELPCDLAKALNGCLGSEDQRRGEFGGCGPAAVAWLGLINKRLGEVL
jgi:hypothetical protein